MEISFWSRVVFGEESIDVLGLFELGSKARKRVNIPNIIII